MVKWCMVKWCNGEIKIRIGCFVSHKYLICWFILFLNTTFLYQTKKSITLPSLRLCKRHRHRWLRYIDTTKITVWRFVWDCSVFTQYIYYHDFFCLGPSYRLRNCHCHVWVRYIDTTKITVWCMSSLLLSIDLLWLCYFIMFYFKLTNGAMVKWWMVKWCNDEINKSIGRFVSHRYWIYWFVLFLNTNVLQQAKKSITFNFLSLTTSTGTKFMLSNQATTERQDFIRGQAIIVREIVTLI